MQNVNDKVIEDCLEIAFQFGQIDGEHHKNWVIDQMVRKLCGSETKYKKWVKNFEKGVDGPKTYEWNEGTPP